MSPSEQAKGGGGRVLSGGRVVGRYREAGDRPAVFQCNCGGNGKQGWRRCDYLTRAGMLG